MKSLKAFLSRISATFLAVTLTGMSILPVSGNAESKNFSARWALTGDSARVKPYSRQPSSQALKWADKELKRMSLDEKIGQLISVGINATFLNQDSEAFKALRHQVVDNHIGGIILFRGPVYESVMIVNRMQELAKYPLLISADLEAGAGMGFDDTINLPWNMAIQRLTRIAGCRRSSSRASA